MGESAKSTKADKTSKMVKFWNGVKAEFKKITWPDKDSLLKQSIAVVAVSVVVGIIITVLDFALQYGVDFLTTL
ncbi:MAG: preprotein translocase subunit SecE [Lachnospiraceae bacterium]|nr:preprotein translocase subunit SecE [Lachnospiraceae bacterium]